MDAKQTEGSNSNVRIQDMLKTLSKCKVDFVNESKEYNKVKETNIKLEIELKEARELVKSHSYQLQNSRDMIGNLQTTVSHLVYLKRDIKKLKDEIISKDITIASMKKDKESMEHTYNESVTELRRKHENQMDELIRINAKKLEQVCNDADTKVALLTCKVEELRNILKETELAHRDKANAMVLEYEEKIQRSAVEMSLLQEQFTTQEARSKINIDAYRKKLEDLEEKLRHSQFKEYLAKNTYSTQRSQSLLENRVEKPYSDNQDYIPQSPRFSTTPVCPSQKPARAEIPNLYTNRAFRTPALQVMYYDSKKPESTNNTKGLFKLTKKRKLYSDTDFIDQN